MARHALKILRRFNIMHEKVQYMALSNKKFRVVITSLKSR